MILVTGATGQLGSDVVNSLKDKNIDYFAIGHEDLDITDKEAVLSYFQNKLPAAVIHCAAYTAVDKAEDEPDLCEKVNSFGSQNIARACAAINAKMMYISTDYVFNGGGDIPYTNNSPTHPQSTYGKAKLAGELAVKSFLEKYFIVRISWVFGKHGNNFVKTMLKLGKERVEINVVDDQVGSPTYTADLAPLLCDMIKTDKYGTYHATNEGYCSWADFAQEIMKIADLDCKINRIPTSEYPTKAIRPLNSRLDKSSLDEQGFKRLPHWKDAVEIYLNTRR